MSEYLTDEDREALVDVLPPGERMRHVPSGPLMRTVEAIVARHVEAERERIAQAIEAEAAKYPRSLGMGLPAAARSARGGTR